MQVISTIGLITINETLFIQLISFLIFLFVINRIMFRPLRNTILERDTYISATQHDIVDAEKEMEAVAKQLIEKEADVRAEANQIREKTELMGFEEADKIFASAREEIATLKEENKKIIDAKIAEARKDFTKESEKLALDIMEKILNRRVSG